MPTPATFAELIAGRDFTVDDDTFFTTPGPVDCPNGDHATLAAHTGNLAYFPDPSGVFLLPWGVNDWTLELWLLNTTGDGTSGRMFGLTDLARSGPSFRWDLTFNGTDVALVLYDAAGVFSPIASTPQTGPGTGVWGHYVWTVNSSLGIGAAAGRRVRPYRNGVVGTDHPFTAAFTSSVPSGCTLWLPNATFSTAWEYAKVAIYHRELDATDVMDHYLLMTT